MAFERAVASVIELVCVAIPAVVFFFVIIGVYGVRAAIAGLIIFIAVAFSIFRTPVKEGSDHEA